MPIEYFLFNFCGPRAHFNNRAVDCSRLTFGPRGREAWDVNYAREATARRERYIFDAGMAGSLQVFTHLMSTEAAAGRIA